MKEVKIRTRKKINLNPKMKMCSSSFTTNFIYIDVRSQHVWWYGFVLGPPAMCKHGVTDIPFTDEV